MICLTTSPLLALRVIPTLPAHLRVLMRFDQGKEQARLVENEILDHDGFEAFINPDGA
jgi:hypothetical protein